MIDKNKLVLIKIILLSGIVFIINACSMNDNDAGRETNFETVSLWEDGLRTSMAPGTFEWWYFDAQMSDGTKVVVVFYTKDMFNLNASAAPIVSIEITPPGEETIRTGAIYNSSEASFSKESFDVSIGPNYGSGDLSDYVIHAEIDDIIVDLNLHSTIPAWRPGDGYLYFGEEKELYFAWLPAVPNGEIQGEISYNGATHTVTGSGYHDHNWGNAPMNSLFKNWWWTRGEVGEYTFIAAELRTQSAFGGEKLPILLVANSNGVVADASLPGATMALIEKDIKAHPDTKNKESIAHEIDLIYRLENDSVDISLKVDSLLSSADLLMFAEMSDAQSLLLNSLGVSPWYTRFITETTLDIDTDSTTFNGVGFSILEKMDLE